MRIMYEYTTKGNVTISRPTPRLLQESYFNNRSIGHTSACLSRNDIAFLPLPPEEWPTPSYSHASAVQRAQHPESFDDWPPALMKAAVAVVSPSAGGLFHFKTTSTSWRIWAELGLHRLIMISETHPQKGHSITKMGWTHIKLGYQIGPAKQGPRLRQKWSQWSHLKAKHCW